MIRARVLPVVGAVSRYVELDLYNILHLRPPCTMLAAAAAHSVRLPRAVASQKVRLVCECQAVDADRRSLSDSAQYTTC